jgi:hypothetical protein
MTMMLQWRRVDPAIVTRWRGPQRGGELPQPKAPVHLAAIIGLPGRNGLDAISYDIAMTAAEDVGGHRAIAADAQGDAVHGDPASAAGGLPVIGMSLNAASIGDEVIIRTAATVEEPAWNWAPGSIYLGAEGTLTQVVPVSGAIVVVGTAVGPHRIRVAPRLVARIT